MKIIKIVKTPLLRIFNQLYNKKKPKFKSDYLNIKKHFLIKCQRINLITIKFVNEILI